MNKLGRLPPDALDDRPAPRWTIRPRPSGLDRAFPDLDPHDAQEER
jgi:hypothetical protein